MYHVRLTQTNGEWSQSVIILQCSSYVGKRTGAKEIGHNLARERPKFGHNLVRERPKFGHNLVRERQKIGHSESSLRTRQVMGTILWPIDENMGTTLQALYSSSAV